MAEVRACLSDLDALAGEHSSEKRRELLNRVTDLFFLTVDEQTGDENAVFGSVMERVAYELEIEARAALSRRLSTAVRAPADLIRRLARDTITVARPILENSTVLTEEDLTEIVRTQSQDHLYAVAGRHTLSQAVTSALVEKGDDRVLTRVTSNTGANLSSHSLEKVAGRARGNENILLALARRKDVPSGLMEGIKKNVKERIKAELAASGADADMAAIDSLVEMSAGDIDLQGLEVSHSDLMQKGEHNQLTETHLVRLARERKLPEVVAALALMTGFDSAHMSFCMTRADVSALAILCKAQGFANSTFLSLLEIRLAKHPNAAIITARAMREYERLSSASAGRALRFVKLRKNNTP